MKKIEFETVEQEQVYNCLPTKPAQVHHNEISKLTGLNKRVVRLIIQELRVLGVPIACTPREGYFIAQHSQELVETINVLCHSRDTLNDTICTLFLRYDELKEAEHE